MAHLPPNAAIFSPSVARAAASAARDWSYVDSWLQRRFQGRGPPPFERNADTLRVLLALAAANEAADEERALIARLEAETLHQLRAYERQQALALATPEGSANGSRNSGHNVLADAREAILASVESSLTRDGRTALDAMASLALQTGLSLPTPAALGEELISLSAECAVLEQAISRVQTLAAYIAREADATARLAAELRPPSPDHHLHDPSEADAQLSSSPSPSPQPSAAAAAAPLPPQPGSRGYHPPANLAIQNLETQRRIKALSARVPELRDKAAALAKSVTASTSTSTSTTSPSQQTSSSSSSSSSSFSPSSPPSSWPPSTSIQHLQREEAAYLALAAEKQALEARVRAFQGLPPDTEQARRELEALRAELRRVTARRDAVFEGLVERETPRRKGSAR